MARNQADLLFRFLGEAKNLVSASKKASGALGGVDKAADKTRGRLSKAGKAAIGFGIAAGAAAAGAVAAWSFQGAKLASQAEATAAALERTLGGAAAGLRTELDATRQGLGLTTGEMDALLSKTTALAKGTGLSEQASAELAAQLVRTAADQAAATGFTVSGAESIEIMNSVLKGEFERLENLNIKISQNMVNQKALNLTNKTSVSELTAQDKALAAVALVSEQASDNQGEFNRQLEAGILDGNIMTSTMGDLQLQVGRELMPAFRDLVSTLVENKASIVKLVQALVGLIKFILFVVEAVSNVGPVWSANFRMALRIVDLLAGRVRAFISSALSPVARAFGTVSSAISRVVTWFDRLKSRIRGGLGSIRNPFSSFRIPSFHRGGVVPGATGSEQLAVLQGGETVLPVGANAGVAAGRSGGTVILEIDGREIGRAIMPAIVDDLRLGTGIRK